MKFYKLVKIYKRALTLYKLWRRCGEARWIISTPDAAEPWEEVSSEELNWAYDYVGRLKRVRKSRHNLITFKRNVRI